MSLTQTRESEFAGQRSLSRHSSPRRPWDISVAEFMTRFGTDIEMTPGAFYNPWEHARRLDIQVLERPITTANGLWLPDYQTIVIRDDMSPMWKRNVMAHEIGHAMLGHAGSNPANEFAADRIAVSNLVTTDMVSWALAESPHDVSRAARLIGLTTRMLRAFATPIRDKNEIETAEMWIKIQARKDRLRREASV